MLDNLPILRRAEDSLTVDEQKQVIDITRTIPGKWVVNFDQSSFGDIYACLVPPWSDGLTSAFLIERQDNGVVLTDRVSDPARDIVSIHPNVAEVMGVVLTTVLGDIVPDAVKL